MSRVDQHLASKNKPTEKNVVDYQEDIWVGNWGLQKCSERPAFHFGFGLSYTKFSYENFEFSDTGGSNGMPSVSFGVRNSGGRTSSSIVQLYADLGRRTI